MRATSKAFEAAYISDQDHNEVTCNVSEDEEGAGNGGKHLWVKPKGNS